MSNSCVESVGQEVESNAGFGEKRLQEDGVCWAGYMAKTKDSEAWSGVERDHGDNCCEIKLSQ